MEFFTSLPGFLLAVLLISASPGPAMALILRRAALQGFRATVPTVLGLELGIYLWAIMAGAGLAALVAASEAAYLVLRVVGAAVLIYLGVQSWRAALRDRVRRTGGTVAADRADPTADPAAGAAAGAVAGAVAVDGRSGWWAFGEGVVVQLANPKAAVFMFAFYPQFVPAGQPLLATTAVLAAFQVVLETAFYLSLAALVGTAKGWFSRPVIRCRLNAVSGTVLIALGLRVAATSR